GRGPRRRRGPAARPRGDPRSDRAFAQRFARSEGENGPPPDTPHRAGGGGPSRHPWRSMPKGYVDRAPPPTAPFRELGSPPPPPLARGAARGAKGASATGSGLAAGPRRHPAA